MHQHVLLHLIGYGISVLAISYQEPTALDQNAWQQWVRRAALNLELTGPNAPGYVGMMRD